MHLTYGMDAGMAADWMVGRMMDVMKIGGMKDVVGGNGTAKGTMRNAGGRNVTMADVVVGGGGNVTMAERRRMV